VEWVPDAITAAGIAYEKIGFAGLLVLLSFFMIGFSVWRQVRSEDGPKIIDPPSLTCGANEFVDAINDLSRSNHEAVKNQIEIVATIRDIREDIIILKDRIQR